MLKLDKLLKIKVILLTIAATLAVENLAVTVLCGFNVIHVGLGKEKPVTVVVVSPTDQTTQTTEETTTTSTTEPTEEETTTTKKKKTTKKAETTATAATAAPTEPPVGDNDGEWVPDWF